MGEMLKRGTNEKSCMWIRDVRQEHSERDRREWREEKRGDKRRRDKRVMAEELKREESDDSREEREAQWDVDIAENCVGECFVLTIENVNSIFPRSQTRSSAERTSTWALQYTKIGHNHICRQLAGLASCSDPVDPGNLTSHVFCGHFFLDPFILVHYTFPPSL